MKYSHHASRTIVELTKFWNFFAHSPYAFISAGPSSFKKCNSTQRFFLKVRARRNHHKMSTNSIQFESKLKCFNKLRHISHQCSS